MSHTTGMLQWMAINSSEGIGKEGEAVGSVLIVWSLVMVRIGLSVSKNQGEGQQGRYHGGSL